MNNPCNSFAMYIDSVIDRSSYSTLDSKFIARQIKLGNARIQSGDTIIGILEP